MKKLKKILIIEDEPDVAETMKLLMERGGYETDYTLDPKKGLEMIKSYDLLLLDIMMPVMSGREVLANMKKKRLKTPVIIVSAVGLPEEMAREFESKWPGTGFVAKTSMHDELIEKIKEKIGE